jgi:dipeptidyl aminopeptidase/acylaminoacyl peptidase
VLYTVSELGKWKDNKRVTSIWLAGVDGRGARRFLGHEKDRNAAWSPDGRFVAFLSTRDAAQDRNEGDSRDDEAAQIWIIPADGGEATRLTSHKSAIRAFEWTRDASAIVFTAAPPKSDDTKAGEKAGDDVIVVDEGANGQDRGDFTELWRVQVPGGAESRIGRDDHLLIENFRVSPDGGKIAVIYRRENTRNGQHRAEVAVVDVESGALTDVTHNDAPEQNVQWSPDGKTLSFLAPSDTSWELAEEKLWLIPAAGGTPRRLLNNFAGAIRQYAWAADGASVLVGAQTRARGAAYRVAIPSGAVTKVAGGDWSGAVESCYSDASRGAAVFI